ncbi:hypothetical protein [Photobacterium alginatilyticum]|uniref:Uncharacterized protein n=1 Tax=Photobacterium alginatilyticum TaxID=1775171 RepID=A0ABW9YRC8_9GAMM|nr:hypothetical protein [Photobacterium alginatilyticum]NBI56309.1 hypothetical protein [Photobacterium alginatilyticum]
MKYVIYYEDDRIEKYLISLSKRVVPLVKNAKKEQILGVIECVNQVRGYYDMVPTGGDSFSRETLEHESDEHIFLRQINQLSENLLSLLEGNVEKDWQKIANNKAIERFKSGLSSFEAAKEYPLSTLPNPEQYQIDNVSSTIEKKHLQLEIDLDNAAKTVERVPSFSEIADSLRAINVSSSYMISKCLKVRGRPKSAPNQYLLAAVSQLDESFKEHFPKLKGRTNGTPFQQVAFEILCDEFFGSNTKEQIKIAIRQLKK